MGLLRLHESRNHDLSGFLHTSPRASNGTKGSGLVSLLSALNLEICRLDRRPLLGAKTFAHVYIVEVDDSDRPSRPTTCSSTIPGSTVVEDATDLQSNKPFVGSDGDVAWASRLREAVNRIAEADGDGEILGCW